MISTLAQVSIAPLDTHVSAFRLIQSGGWLMVLLGFLSITAGGVFLERFFYFKRSRMNVNEFMAGVLALIRRQSYAEAMARCDEGHGPLVGVVRTAIYKRHLPPNELREIVREIAQLEIPQLEANISLLGTIGYVAPLLGLFGTVSGMIEAFIKINRTSGTASVTDLSQGVYQALITTAAGLAVAIPCYLAHNFLVAQVHSVTADMERAGIETIHTLTDLPRKETIAFQPEVSDKKQQA
jgi:biopolymer transport protein ExbB